MRRHTWAAFAVVITLSPQSTTWAEEDGDKDADKSRKHEALFVQLDTNEDGGITIDEVPEEKQRLLKRLFKTGDANSDERLSREEFLAALTEKRAMRPLVKNPEVDSPTGDNRPDPRMIFRRLDANGDGVVRVDELPEKVQGFFSKVLEKADEDGDDALGPRELGKALRAISERRPELLRYFGFTESRDAPSRDDGLMRALDGDGNGELSSEEIAKSPEVLRTLDTDNDGLVSRRELHAPGELAKADKRDRPAAEMIVKRIKQADRDGDGRISRDEAPERLQRGFDRIDSDGDGFLDRDEIVAGAKAMRDRDGRKRPGGPQGGKKDGKRPTPEMLLKHIMQADADGDGRISRDEAPERLQRGFDRIDSDGDGFLDRDEITNHAKAMAQKGGRKNPKQGRKGRPKGGKKKPNRPDFN